MRNQPIPGEVRAVGDPDPQVVERDREPPVELLGGLVAVHHAPPDETAAGRVGCLADLGQQGAAEAAAPEGGTQVEIVDEGAAGAPFGIVAVMEQGIAGRRAVDLGDQAGKGLPGAEAVARLFEQIAAGSEAAA